MRILLADDHTMVRQSMRRALEEEGFAVVGEAGDGAEAVRLAADLRPDVVVMDVTMPVLDGLEATRRVRQQEPDVQVVVLTMHADRQLRERAAAAGAAAYLTKDCSIGEVARAVREAAGAGEDPGAAGGLLTPREEEVLRMIAGGASPAEVADQLFISARTVKNHLSNIYAKLDARDRTQAVAKAARLGIIRLG